MRRSHLLPLSLVTLVLCRPAHAQTITTVAGGLTVEGGPAIAAGLNTPRGLATGPDGALYIADTNSHRVLRVTPDGRIVTYAGNGTSGFSGDGGPATSAQLNFPTFVAFAPDGSLYIADSYNNCIRRVSTKGIISTVAGVNGESGLYGDGGPATSATLSNPNGIAFGRDGSLYIADTDNNRIRRVAPNGAISTFAGSGTSDTPGFGGDNGPATAARFDTPFAVAVGPDGSVYIADNGNNRIRRVAPNGTISTFAGNGTATFSGDGGPASAASINSPYGITVAPDGTVYFADSSNSRIRRVTPNGTISTFAGNGNFQSTGDGGPAISAAFTAPLGLTLGSDNSLYIADYGAQRIRRVTPSGTIATFAGNGGFFGDGAGATLASLFTPSTAAVGPDNSVYIADTANNRIRRLTPDGIITTVAGTGVPGARGDGGPATSARLNQPYGIAAAPDGSLYIADSNNHRIRRVSPDGVISTIAGNGVYGFGGDGGPATSAQLAGPSSIALAPDGSVYIADYGNARIRRVTPDGKISTVAGTGVAGFSGDGGPATSAQLNSPSSIAVNPTDGSLYIADTANNRIRRVSITNGRISTVAGNGVNGYDGDGGPAASAQLSNPTGISIDPSGLLYIVDSYNNVIRLVTPAGAISTIAGSGDYGYSGDNGPASAAAFNTPFGVAAAADGSFYIVDAGNNRIRRVSSSVSTPAPYFGISTSALALQFDAGQLQANPEPVAFAVDNGPVSWTATASKPWITFSPAGGTTYTGTATIAVNIDTTQLPAGQQSDGEIVIDSGGAASKTHIPVAVTIQRQGSALSKTSTQSMAFYYPGAAAPQYLVLVTPNAGTRLVVSSNQPWLTATASAPGIISSISTISVSVDPTQATPGENRGVIVVQDASGQVLTIQALLYLSPTSGPPPTPVTITSTPVGQSVLVDGAPIVTPATLVWTPGSSHTLDVLTPQLAVNGARYIFANWSQGGAKSQTVLAPNAATTLTATFTTQYQLTAATSPAAGGSLTANPPSTDGYYYAGTPVVVTATPATGFTFANFSGDATGTTNPQTLTMNAPKTVAANFTAVQQTTPITITSTPPGLTVIVDGAPTVTPATFNWAPNSPHTFQAQTAIANGAGSRLVFANWSNNNTTAAAQTITTPTAATTYTASYTTQYLLTLGVSTASAGSMAASPTSPDGFYTQNAQVTVTASPATGFTFTGFSGDATGATNPQTVSLTGPKSVTASFQPALVNVIATPSTVSFNAVQGASDTKSLSITGDPASISISAANASPWLRYSPSSGQTPAAITLTAAAQGLTAGSYSDTLLIAGPNFKTLQIPVTFTVTQPPPTAQLITSAAQGGLYFESFGEAPTAQSIDLTSTGDAVPFTTTIVKTDSANWLTITPASGSASAVLHQTINVTVDVRPLPGYGIYYATLRFTRSTAPNDVLADVQVSFNYQQGAPKQMQINVPQISRTSSDGSPQKVGLAVTNPSPVKLTFTASASTDNGGAWITVDPPKEGVSKDSPGMVTITLDPTGLPNGVYTATLTFADSDAQLPAQQVPVTFTVQGKPSLTLADLSLAFQLLKGQQALPRTLPFVVAGGSGATLNWIITADQPWITFGNSRQASLTGSGGPGAYTATVNIDAATLQASENHGSIKFDTGDPATSRTLSVVVTLLPQGTQFTRIDQPGMVFTTRATQTANFVATRAGSVNVSTNQPWLQATAGSAPVGVPLYPITVSVDPSKTTLAENRGTVTIQDAAGQASTISVLLYKAGGASNGNRRTTTNRDLAAPSGGSNCQPSQYFLQFASVGPNWPAQPAGAPFTMDVLIVDDCGNLVTSGAVAAGTLSTAADPQLSLQPLTDGTSRWRATWTPDPTGVGSYVLLNGIASKGSDISPAAAPAPIPILLNSPVALPAISKSNPMSCPSGQPLNYLAPGLVFTINGSQFLTGSTDVHVFLAGRELPIQSRTDRTLTIQTPLDLDKNVESQLIVKRGDATSVPITVSLATSSVCPVGPSQGNTKLRLTGLGAEAEHLKIEGNEIRAIRYLGDAIWELDLARPLEKGPRLSLSGRAVEVH